jgi:hypothetical protein
VAVVAPKPMGDAGIATTKQIHFMGGSLTTPTAPQMTDVDPNRCGEPVNPPKGTLTPLGRGGGQLVLGFPLNTVVANTLVIIGVLFTAVYPSKAPARQVYRDFAKYYWRVSVEPSKPREEGEYDVVIVGAGIGGLTCGAILSKHGYRVLILEQNFQVGGYCSSFTRRGFVFNTGVEDVSGLWENGPVMYLLRELGLRREDLFVENTRRIIYKGRVIDVPNDPDQLVELLSDLFPSERGNIQLFLMKQRKLMKSVIETLACMVHHYHQSS